MDTQDYHIKRNAIYQKLVDAKLIEDTDDNFEILDTILGETLDVDWGIIIVGMGHDVQGLATKIAALKGELGVIIAPPQSNSDTFREPTMRISNYRVEDFLLTTPKYDGTNTSKFNKSNTKNWKK